MGGLKDIMGFFTTVHYFIIVPRKYIINMVLLPSFGIKSTYYVLVSQILSSPDIQTPLSPQYSLCLLVKYIMRQTSCYGGKLLTSAAQ